ncbi:MgtC/SapB family protein [Bombilactobacillus thymidiniphilus]|uniref:MgtC/SapB family protein n=1 Tax=Bombilactobacillus thymidiniphilus TaxID=2923363 RepID=A0ABY4PBU2_9LACO|nr:MgtC/SapB family protein [Bombilactobacillus thymidiniphilus]UQS83138.1 MgtC/SapB family protein [Bombilactobacillus thymidiniphilus]
MGLHLPLSEIIIRLLLAVFCAGLIGYNRQQRNHSAGVRTHILVCVGACIIAMIQKEIGFDALNVAARYPHYAGVLRADNARLIAQVVSGVGFLGAGTILVHHHVVRGLTTAASLWTVAGLGLAVGMGNYEIAVAGTVVIFLVLTALKRIFHIVPVKKIMIEYRHKKETKEFIQKYFDMHNITVRDVNFNVSNSDTDNRIYTNIYEIEIPNKLNYANIIEDISMNKNVMAIKMISV